MGKNDSLGISCVGINFRDCLQKNVSKKEKSASKVVALLVLSVIALTRF